MSSNGWMNDDLAKVWLNNVLGILVFSCRLLVWDSFRCHTSEETKLIIKNLKLNQAIIPSGCTSIIQAPDECWNAPFKARMRKKWDTWMTSGGRTFTKGGNMRAPTKLDLVVLGERSMG